MEDSPCLNAWKKLPMPEGCQVAGTVAEDLPAGLGTAGGGSRGGPTGFKCQTGVGGDDAKAPLSLDWAAPAVFPGHLVLAGDAGRRRRGDERHALLRHRASPAAVSEARAGALLPRLRALLGRGFLHRQ